MFNIGPWELMAVLIVALIIFGPGKLPDVGKALGKALGEFKNASKGLQDVITKSGDKDENPEVTKVEAKVLEEKEEEKK